MQPTAVCVLVACAVLATGSEGNWVKKTFRKVGDVTKDIVKNEAVKGLTNIIKGVGPEVVGGMVGKRSVDWSSLLTQAGGTVAKDLVRELDLACTHFNNVRGKPGMSADDLRVAFGEIDGNKDGHLNEQELDLFENTIEAVQHCLGSLIRKGK